MLAAREYQQRSYLNNRQTFRNTGYDGLPAEIVITEIRRLEALPAQ